MKLSLAPFLAAALSSWPSSSGVAAFRSSRPGAVAARRAASSATAPRPMASLAELDPVAAPPPARAPAAAGEAAEGEVLSLLSAAGAPGSFAVVKLLQEDMLPAPTALSAVGAGVSGGADGSVPLAGDEEEAVMDKVELADALFGKSGPPPQQNRDLAPNAAGDLTGRVVTFADASTGTVVAHRHPVAFVLRDSPPAATGPVPGEGCVVAAERVAVDPAAVPAGSTVDYLGRHVAVHADGSVGRTLPRAARSAAGAVAATISMGINLDNERRPIFMPIPTISQIGLIDSPLVTGITAIDALTPIGKGQNMLLIGQEEGTEAAGRVDKRGWAINLLRNVVENHRHRREGEAPAAAEACGERMRCFYGLTSGDDRVRASVREGIAAAGIQDDIVTVVSGRGADRSGAPVAEDGAEYDDVMEAAEAVAVAATACTLGEHHALATGGDAVVVIDDLNLHKELWDVTTRELVKAYGVDAVVAADRNGGGSSEMRGFFSGLVQRAARFGPKKGGGSVTLLLLSTLPGAGAAGAEEEGVAFEAADFDAMSDGIRARVATLVGARVPLTPVNLAKIRIPNPRPSATEDARRLALQHVDDLISMSDGQVWLDAKLAEGGRSPPLDPSRSITRVGVGADTPCRADAPALRSVVGSLRFDFQQAMDVLEASASAAAAPASATVDATKQVRRRDAFLLAMQQEPSEVRRLSQECVSLLAAARGHLDGVLAAGGKAGTLKGKEAMDGMLDFVEKEAGAVMRSVDETLDLSSEERVVLEELLASYFSELERNRS